MKSKRREIYIPPGEERTFFISISQNEMVALVRFHTSRAKRVTKAYGQAALMLQSKRPFNSARDLKALGDLAKDQLEFHTSRAKGLMSLLPKR